MVVRSLDKWDHESLPDGWRHHQRSRVGLTQGKGSGRGSEALVPIADLGKQILNGSTNNHSTLLCVAPAEHHHNRGTSVQGLPKDNIVSSNDPLIAYAQSSEGITSAKTSGRVVRKMSR